MLLERELLEAKVAALEGGRPLVRRKVTAMSLTVSPSSGRPYGVARVCRVWRAARATVYHHRRPPRMEPPKRPGRVGSIAGCGAAGCDPGRLRGQPLSWRGSPQNLGEAAHEGRSDLPAPGAAADACARPARPIEGRQPPRGPRNHDGTIIPDAVDVMWGTDMTTTWTAEGQAAVSVAVDHHSAGCVGLHAARRDTRFEALEPSGRACARTSAASPRALRQVSRCAMTMARTTCPMPSRASSRFSASRAHPPSCGHSRRMAAPALHPHPEREPPLGADLRHRRATAPSAPRVPLDL